MSKRKIFKYTYHCLGCNKEYRTDDFHPYGYICKKCRNKVKENISLKIPCSICGKDAYISWQDYKKKYPNGPFRCKECLKKLQSKNTTNQWNSMSKEEYNKHCSKYSKAQLIIWKRRSKEERTKYMEPVFDGRNNWRKNMTLDEQIEHSLKLSIAGKKSWENKSIEYRKLHMEPCQKGSKLYRKNLSYSDRIFKDLNHALKWNELPNDYKINQVKSPGEFQLIEILNSNNIPYKLHYYSTAIYDTFGYYYPNIEDFNNFNEWPQFRQLFPNNPISNSNYICPFHEWDFGIIKDNKFYMFIDVDGSIHNPNLANSEVTDYYGNKFILNESVKFYEAQRFYQTDGLYAYIIKSYNNKITDETPVIDIRSNTKKSFKEFLINIQKLIKIINK